MANTYLSRTSGTPTNALKWTFSAWVKIASIPNDTFLLDFNTDGNNRSNIGFQEANDRFIVYEKVSGSTNQLLETTRVFRDHNAWYHIVASCDRTLATASDRTKIYINGVRETSFSTETQPTQNATGIINTGVNTLIGKYSQSGLYFDGCLSHVHFVDGTAYDASTFGETDATSGIWKPKTAPSVTYGNNGFFLKFENSGAMGTDSSGNSNTFTVSGTLTQNVDTPSNNFATWNPISTAVARSGGTFANGNTTITTVAAKYNGCPATLGMSSGKYYFEVKWSSGSDDESLIGIQSAERTSDIQELGHFATDYGYYSNNGNIRSNDAYQGSFGNTYSVNDIIGVAVDLDNNKLYFSKNGVWQNSGVPTSGSTGTGAFSITDPDSTPTGFYFPAISGWSNSHAHTFQANFGQGYFGTTAVASAGTAPSEGGIFEYDCPSGYQALCTKGINSF